ncbi:MAG: LysR family transcriptional regulator, partial [Anaerotignum sp.]|nr:LysR family transcriptional regulator [Anaerotignum sp.]
MKIENLKIFLEVAQSESINEAARNLFMTHQNLNKIIKNLEAELNTQLFVRTNKGILLTSNGKELFVTASQ